jgi:penicillin-binding protein 1B
MATRPPAPPRRRKPAPAAKPRSAAAPKRAATTTGWRAWRQHPWMRRLLWASAIGAVLFVAVTIYYWIVVARMIDKRLGGGEDRPMPRIFGRAFEITPGQTLSVAELRSRLNNVGYSERPKAEQPGEFTTTATSLQMMTKAETGTKPELVKIDFSRGTGSVVTKITPAVGKPLNKLQLESPMLAALATGERRRYVPLAQIPKRMVQAVLAIEDRRFYEHPGIDPIGAIGALIRNIRGDKAYLAGGSTLTQQIVKNTFLTPEKTIKRKLSEQFIAVVMERRLTKDQILELYLNEVVLGQRGPFEIHGVAEASRVFFGVDLRNISVAQAATIAGVIQSPSRLSPFRNPERALERRNLVLREMADDAFITPDEKTKAQAEPIGVSARAMENEAPYFVDYVSQLVDEGYTGLLKKDAAVDVYTTLDVHLQRLAQEALAEGLAQVDKQLLARKKKDVAQAAMVVADPRTGEILAMIGGRGYNQSQYNRAVTSRRQPGSTFKPFVYLAAFEKMAETSGHDLTPSTVEIDEPTTWIDDQGKPYTPSNYQNEYDGPVTLRFALAHSRNIVAIKVAEQAGYDRVADLWKKVGEGSPAKPYPSIALGVFEASTLEMASAYTLFANGGLLRPLHPIMRISENGQDKKLKVEEPRQIARADTTYLVTNMMRSVINEGTGADARAQGFRLDAAGKTGTTNDQRDAWFIGFTPDLLVAVWVGFDNNNPIGLTGAQAALPIWTAFMKRATAGRPDKAFEVPDGLVFVDIDKETGKLATPGCLKTIREAFLAGSEPTELCPLHK